MSVPNKKTLSPEMQEAMQPRTPFGNVWPPKANPSSAAEDGRTVGLFLFSTYLSELTFRRKGEKMPDGSNGPPIEFSIPEERIFVEWPDNEEQVELPAMVFLSVGPAQYDALGLNNYVDESTRDKFGKGTVVMWQNEHTENVVLECWCDKKPVRRAIVAGLEVALSPTEQMYGLRFKMKDYFDQSVCFSLQSKELIDDPDASRNRRRVRFTIEMRFNVVALINYVQLTPLMTTKVDYDPEAVDGVLVLDDMDP